MERQAKGARLWSISSWLRQGIAKRRMRAENCNSKSPLYFSNEMASVLLYQKSVDWSVVMTEWVPWTHAQWSPNTAWVVLECQWCCWSIGSSPKWNDQTSFGSLHASQKPNKYLWKCIAVRLCMWWWSKQRVYRHWASVQDWLPISSFSTTSLRVYSWCWMPCNVISVWWAGSVVWGQIEAKHRTI